MNCCLQLALISEVVFPVHLHYHHDDDTARHAAPAITIMARIKAPAPDRKKNLWVFPQEPRIAECAQRHTPLCPLTMNIADPSMRHALHRPSPSTSWPHTVKFIRGLRVRRQEGLQA